MICRNCGRENEPGDKFCAVCGAILDVPVEPAPAAPVETPEAPVVPAPEAPYVPAAAPEAPYVPPAAPKASYAPAAEVPYAPAAPEMPYGAPEMPYMPPVGAPDPAYAAPDPAYAAPMGVPAPGFAAPKKKALNFTFSFKMIPALLGVLSGLISLIMSFVVRGMHIGGYVSSSTYGGDAYTGIQNAAAETANYVSTLSRVVRSVGADVLLVLGLAIIAYFAYKLLENVED